MSSNSNIKTTMANIMVKHTHYIAFKVVKTVRGDAYKCPNENILHWSSWCSAPRRVGGEST